MSPVHLPHHFQQGSYLWIAIYRPLLKVKHSNLQRSRAALRNTLRDWEMATLNESPVTLICRTCCTKYGTKHIRRKSSSHTYGTGHKYVTYFSVEMPYRTPHKESANTSQRGEGSAGKVSRMRATSVLGIWQTEHGQFTARQFTRVCWICESYL